MIIETLGSGFHKENDFKKILGLILTEIFDRLTENFVLYRISMKWYGFPLTYELNL